MAGGPRWSGRRSRRGSLERAVRAGCCPGGGLGRRGESRGTSVGGGDGDRTGEFLINFDFGNRFLQLHINRLHDKKHQ